jgi:hypothetical protein
MVGLERTLIAERVRAGIGNARAKGREHGRLRVSRDAARIATLRVGVFLEHDLPVAGTGKGTAQQAFSGAAAPFDFEEDRGSGVLASASWRTESSRLSSHNSFR